MTPVDLRAQDAGTLCRLRENQAVPEGAADKLHSGRGPQRTRTDCPRCQGLGNPTFPECLPPREAEGQGGRIGLDISHLPRGARKSHRERARLSFAPQVRMGASEPSSFPEKY